MADGDVQLNAKPMKGSSVENNLRIGNK